MSVPVIPSWKGGEYLTIARRRRSVSQADVAAMLDVSTTTIRRWEGAVQPSRLACLAMAAVLGYDPIVFADVIAKIADTGRLPDERIPG